MKKQVITLLFVCLFTQSCSKDNDIPNLLPGRWLGSYEVELDYADQVGRRRTYEHELIITYLSSSKVYDAEVKSKNYGAPDIFQFRVNKEKRIVIDGGGDHGRYNGAIIRRIDEKNLILELATTEHDLIVPLIMEMRRQ